MKLIVGLGNPGSTYDKTRHNIGFDVIDTLLDRNGLKLTDQKFKADYTIWRTGQEKVLVVKPYTYMNLSGEAVLPLMSYYGVGADDLLVIHDDLDLEPGRLRLRQKGSSGGQNGVKSIINLLGTQEFKRIKIGIGRPQPGWKVVDHVLAPFSKADRVLMEQTCQRAVDAVEDWISGQTFEQVMTKYNN